MRFISFAVFLLLIIGLGISCGNDDDDAQNNLPNDDDSASNDDDSSNLPDDDDASSNDDDSASNDDDDCSPNPSDASRFVIIGFWLTEDCSGEPVNTNAFPIDDEGGCYCWPGNSGSNSAHRFECNPEENSFSYQQWTNLACTEGGNGTYKTSYTDQCLPDVPATLHAKIIEYDACLE